MNQTLSHTSISIKYLTIMQAPLPYNKTINLLCGYVFVYCLIIIYNISSELLIIDIIVIFAISRNMHRVHNLMHQSRR